MMTEAKNVHVCMTRRGKFGPPSKRASSLILRALLLPSCQPFAAPSAAYTSLSMAQIYVFEMNW